MDFFRTLAILFGALSILGSLSIFFFPEGYKKLILNHICKEKRPAWLAVVGVLIIALTVYCWYLLFKEFNPFALILCLYLSLGIIKSFLFLFQYEQMRKFITAILGEEKMVLKMFGALGLSIGVGLLVIGYLI